MSDQPPFCVKHGQHEGMQCPQCAELDRARDIVQTTYIQPASRSSKNLSLLRCPFCGAGAPDIRAKTLEPAFSYVHCERCGAQGPCASDEPHSEVAWNTRQSDETESFPIHERLRRVAIELSRIAGLEPRLANEGTLAAWASRLLSLADHMALGESPLKASGEPT